jgi:uncharacterized protein YndB with AHSA1/START domain
MRTVSETAVIPHPPGVVFQAASDAEAQLSWDAGTLKRVEALTQGPLAKGSRYRGKFKGYGTVEYEYAEYDPPKRFAHLAKIPLGRMRHTFTFENVPEGTKLTQVGELEPGGIGHLIGGLMMGRIQKRFRVIAQELSEYLGREATRG